MVSEHGACSPITAHRRAVVLDHRKLIKIVVDGCAVVSDHGTLSKTTGDRFAVVLDHRNF